MYVHVCQNLKTTTVLVKALIRGLIKEGGLIIEGGLLERGAFSKFFDRQDRITLFLWSLKCYTALITTMNCCVI